MADLRISELPVITAAQLEGFDRLPVADLSASRTMGVAVKDLVLTGVRALPPASVPSGTIEWNLTGAEPWPTLPVNGNELGDNSTLTFSGGGQFIGQLQASADNQISYWTGSTWQPVFGGVGSITLNAASPLTGAALPSPTVVGQWDVGIALSSTTAARQFLAGPSLQNGAVSYRPIVGTDLPAATTTTLGAVSVPGNGLAVFNGALSINNSVNAQLTTYSAVTYNEFGLVTGGRALAAGDMPVAVDDAPGAVFPGPELMVAPSGMMSHRSQIAAGSGARVTFNSTGHITGVGALLAADIPPLDASKITSGAISTERIADNSITLNKLADFANAFIQANQPTEAGVPIGTLWLSPLQQQIRMWDGNVWQPIGFGSLSQENLRVGGLFNAATGLLTSVSAAGAAVNLSPGAVIPTATSALAGMYFVNQVAGNGVLVTPGVTYAVGDWILCVSAAEGWQRIATGSGGGGGAASGVTQVTGVVPIRVASGTTTPAVSIDAVTTTVNGAMLAADKVKLNGIAAGAQVNVQADWNATPGTPAAILNRPQNVTVPDASTTVAGIVRLATSADVTAGLTDRAVTANLLRDRTSLASTTVDGIVRLATQSDVNAGVTNRIVTADLLRNATTGIGGTVTSITAGYGLVPATITTSGTLTVLPAPGLGLQALASGVGINRGVVDTWYASAAQGVRADNALANTGGAVSGTVTVWSNSTTNIDPGFIVRTNVGASPQARINFEARDNTPLGFINSTAAQTTFASHTGNARLVGGQTTTTGWAEVAGGSTSTDPVRFLRGTTTLSRIDTGGNLQVNSDINLKEAVQPVQYGLRDVEALNPISFRYKTDKAEDAVRLGFVAQEVMAAIPEAAQETEDGYTYAPSLLIPAMVSAIKELSARIQQLESEATKS
jgi:hypothetical protein